MPASQYLSPIEQLPDELLVRLFSNLGADDVRACACASTRLAQLTADEPLWRRLLSRETWRWSRLSHNACPPELLTGASANARTEETAELPSCRSIYLSCRPKKPVQSSWSDAWRLLRRTARQLTDRGAAPARIGLVGPGIERSGTGSQVYGQVQSIMLQPKPGRLTTSGLHGVGSGLACRLPGSGRCLQLVAMHSERRDVRERWPSEADRVRASILLVPAEAPSGPASRRGAVLVQKYETIPAVARLQLQGLVYVVDGGAPASELSACRPELDAFVRAMPAGRPVLVLTVCNPDQRLPLACRQVVDCLHLADSTGPMAGRPWLAQNCQPEQLDSLLPECLDWLLDNGGI